MAGIWAASSDRGFAGFDLEGIAEALDPLGHGRHRSGGIGDVRVIARRPGVDAGQCDHFVEDDDFIAAVSGELTAPAFDALLVRQLMGDKAASVAAGLRGTFAIVIACKRTRRLRLISDRTSQQPLFWRRIPGGIACSSTMATFCRLPQAPSLDPQWLYQYLFFSYSVLEQTFLQGVTRMPPATILDFAPSTPTIGKREYAPQYGPPPRVLDENESIECARESFAGALKLAAREPSHSAIALTSGLDSRTLLAFTPPAALREMTAYTYGVPGCVDIEAGAGMAAALGIRYQSIALDACFRSRLPELAWRTVFLSGGLQRVLRASLPHAYSTLARRNPQLRHVIHGAAGDHLFRDHLRGGGNRPHILSHAFSDTIKEGRLTFDEAAFRETLAGRFDDFRECIGESVRGLEDAYGPLGDADAYVRVLLYEAGPKYFAGEAAIANHWFSVQRPFMDPQTAQLAWDTKFGVANVSKTTSVQDRFRERYFQARLIALNPEVAKLKLYDRPLRVFLRATPWRYHAHSVRLAPTRLIQRLRGGYPPLEDWTSWCRNDLGEHFGEILGADSRLGAYLSSDAMDRARASGDIDLIGRLASAEILMRLVENRWRLPAWCRSKSEEYQPDMRELRAGTWGH